MIPAFFYYKQTEKDYCIDDQTARDLDLEALFSAVDHTYSRVGQQVLYDLLRHPWNTPADLHSFGSLVDDLAGDEATRTRYKKALGRLKQPDDSRIVDFLFYDFPPDPSWLKYTRLLQGFLLLCVAASFVYPIAVLGIMLIACVNFVLHYKIKNRFHSFYLALGRIGVLYKTARMMAAPGSGIGETLKVCKKIVSRFWLFDLNNLYYNEMTMPVGVVIELIKILTLAEVRATYKVCGRFLEYREPLLEIYRFVGLRDAALSVGVFRQNLPFYCIPNWKPGKTLHLEQAYHPLIKNAVANDFADAGDRSVFINGTNMSGKTTFIRAVGINALLGRSINTCTARGADLSFFDVYSSIRIEDDPGEGASYYFQELLRLKAFTGRSREDAPVLFIIDEILKGTNIHDRTRIAGSVLSYLAASPQALTLVTSHDVNLAGKLEGVFDFYYFTETIDESGLHFDYQIRKGLSTERNAVKLLSVLEFPLEIIRGLD